MIKGYGPIEALKKSAVTIKKTWGESLIKYYGLGLVKGGLLGIGLLLFLVPAILIGFGTGSFGSALILVGIFIFYSMVVMVLFKSADTIFNTALFLYADSGKVPEFYSKDVLSHAFKNK